MQEDYIKKIESRIAQLRAQKDNSRIFQAVDLMEDALKKGKKVLVFGNGGSSTQASHFAAELVNRFYYDRPPLPALSLTDNMANITAIANDMDFKYVFSRQLEALGSRGDIAVGISTSGKSPNVLAALEKARQIGMGAVALGGRYTAAFEELGCSPIIAVDSEDTPTIQEIHLFVLHVFAEILEKRLFPNGYG